MAKLADLIQQATQPRSAPLGFASARTKPTPSMIVVAQIGDDWEAAAGAAVTAGASMILLSGSPKDAEVKAAAKAAGDSPCGLVPNDTTDLNSLRRHFSEPLPGTQAETPLVAMPCFRLPCAR